MTLQLDAAMFVAFFLAAVRAAAWLAVAPPFSGRTIPIAIKTGFAAALAVSIAPRVAPQLASLRLDTASLVGVIALQVAAGLALGFVAQLLFTAMASAGSLIDLFGGFSVAQEYNPFLGDQAALFSRFYQLLTVTLLFAVDGHLILVHGFLSSFVAVPAQGVSFGHLGSVLTHDMSLFFLAAVEVSAPLLAALFLAQIVLGMLSRAAPAMNVFAVGFPLTVLVTLVLAGFVLPLVPGAVSALVGDTVRSWSSVF